jgi:hypothetical protein
MALVITADQEAGIVNLEGDLEQAFSAGVVDQAAVPVLGPMPLYSDPSVQAVKQGVKDPFKSLIAAMMVALNVKGPLPVGLSTTVALAKLTNTGTDGSLTFVDGILVSKVDPT